MNCTKTHLPLRRSSNARNSYKKKKRRSNVLIECFHSRDQHLCKFIGTKESVYIRKEFNSTGLVWDSTWPPFYCFGTPTWFWDKRSDSVPKTVPWCNSSWHWQSLSRAYALHIKQTSQFRLQIWSQATQKNSLKALRGLSPFSPLPCETSASRESFCNVNISSDLAADAGSGLRGLWYS